MDTQRSHATSALHRPETRASVLLVASMSALLSSPAHSASLSVTPATQTVNVGDQVTFDVYVSLGSGEFVSAYDFDFFFDSSLLQFGSLTFGTGLGGTSDFFSDIDSATSGIIDFSQFSLLAPADLTAAQGTAFQIAELVFSALGVGSVSVGIHSPGDDNFFELYGAADLDLTGNEGAEVTIEASPVPEPGTIVLLGLGLVGLVLGRRRT